MLSIPHHETISLDLIISSLDLLGPAPPYTERQLRALTCSASKLGFQASITTNQASSVDDTPLAGAGAVDDTDAGLLVVLSGAPPLQQGHL